MQKLHKKLNLTKNQLIEIIHQMYWEDNLSQLQIAKKLNCHPTTIENFFRRKEILSRSSSEASKNRKRRIADIDYHQIEILNGLMLSDFHIEKGAFQARLSFGFKHLEFAEFCIEQLRCFEWSALKQDKTTGCWHSKTKFYENLMDYKNIWYKDGKKISPDIDISPTTLLLWFLGDGMVTKDGYGAILCSESFSLIENQILHKKILNLGISNFITKSNRIRISGKGGYKKMLQIIGKCPVECYQYKFKYENIE